MKNNKKFFKKNSPWLSALVLTVMTGALLLSGCGTNATAPNNGSPTTAPAPSTQPAGQDSGSGDNNQTPAPTPTEYGHPIDTAHNNYHGTTVYFQNQSIGFIGGDGFIFRTTDGGKTWNQQWNGSYSITGISFPTASVGFAYGMITDTSPQQYTILTTTDGGQRWTVLSKMQESQAELHFTTDKIGFLSNQMTTDGGMTWKTLPVPSNTSRDSAYFDDVNNGYAVTADDNSFQVIRTTDGGQHWKTTLTKSGPINGARIDSTSPDDAWVLLYGGSGMTQTSYSLFHTADGGKNWTTVVATATAGGGPAPGFPNETTGRKGPAIAPGPVQALDSQTAYLLGICRACGIGANSIGYTKDGGKTWTNNPAKWPGQDAELSFVDQDHGWVIANARGFGSVLYQTSDGGKTWGQEFVFGKKGPPE